ncbi:MAG: SOS response-associated peptidase [Phycisphaerae bacterium]
MCGRFTLSSPADVVARWFQLSTPPPITPRYNIAPTQDVGVVRVAPDSSGRSFCFHRWGLIPSWAADPAIGNRMINARSETAHAKPSFRAAFRQRRCLIPADGFFEWKKSGATKTPHFISAADGGLLAFAGLCEAYRDGDQTIESCTILTVEPNELLAPIHDRMPAILQPADFDAWLDPSHQAVDALRALLRPYPTSRLVVRPVDTFVNNPRNNGPRCIAPVAG